MSYITLLLLITISISKSFASADEYKELFDDDVPVGSGDNEHGIIYIEEYIGLLVLVKRLDKQNTVLRKQNKATLLR